MTREEAIDVLSDFRKFTLSILGKSIYAERCSAIDMAIEALHREEAEEKGYCHRINYIPKPCENANCDCVAVVRCKNCKWYMLTDHNDTEVCTNKQWDISMAVYPIISADGFCSYGERREP